MKKRIKKKIKKLKKSINKINKVRVQKGRKAMLQETWATVTYGLYDNRKIRRLKKFPPALVENRMLFETNDDLRIMVVLCLTILLRKDTTKSMRLYGWSMNRLNIKNISLKM